MISLKLHIDFCSDTSFIQRKQEEYSFAFRKLYNNFNKINDKQFINYLRKQFKLSQFESECLIIDVKAKINQLNTRKVKLKNKIVDIQNEIYKETDKRKLYKLHKKLNQYNQRLTKNIIFGNKHSLIQLSQNQIKFKQSWLNSRILPINYLGEQYQNSNRYFKFNFKNQTILYKSNKNTKIEIKYTCYKNIQNQLLQLQKFIENRENKLAISIKLTSNYICLTFSNEKVNGFSLDETSRNKEIKDIDFNINKETRTKLIKEIYKKYYKEQESKKFINKLANRYLAIDLNPTNIGWSICDKVNCSDFKIINKGCFEFYELLKKSNKYSSHKLTNYINNKRKHEISIIYKKLLSIARHYKAAYLVIEELNFKPKLIKNNNKEFNRKTNNIWNRNFQIQLINKHCENNGIELIKINPMYSSFIGNIKYKYIDSTNASIEICRRGMFKYIKGNSIVPTVSITDQVTMSKLVTSNGNQSRDDLNHKDWKSWFRIMQHLKLKYRWDINKLNENLVKFDIFSSSSNKSKVKLYKFYN